MRPYLAIAFFALAVVVAACGGGGSSSIPTTAPSRAPLNYTSARLTLKIPAQPAAASSGRRPAYVSPNTQSISITAYPVPSASASPAAQMFTVTTPSPCTQNPDGSKSCVFNVQSPVGQVQFDVKTYAVANPGPTTTPLSEFHSAVVTVSAGGTPPALSFTLTGDIATVSLALQNPDPTITTASTQIGTIGTPITSSAISITAKDASGAPIMTDTFTQPVVVKAAPVNVGVSLVLTGTSQCSPASSASGTTATITCASDLAKLAFVYDGTVARDSSGKPIDSIAFTASPQSGSATPTPAYLDLGGTTQTFALAQSSLSYAQAMRFARTSANTYAYMIEDGSYDTTYGIVDLANPSAAQAVNVSGQSPGIAVDRSGDIWLPQAVDGSGANSNLLFCYQGTSASSPPSVQLVTPSGSPQPIQPKAVTTDASGNVWYFGTDNSGTMWAGFIPSSQTSCANAPGTSQALAQVSAYGIYDSPMDMQPANGGVELLAQNSGLLSATTSGTVNNLVVPMPSSGPASLAVDGAGNSYVSFSPQPGTPWISTLPSGSGNFANSITMADNDEALGLSTNTNGTGAASTFAYADYSAPGIGFGSASTLSKVGLLPVGSYGNCFSTFFDANGDPWGGCYVQYAPGSGYSSQLVHVIRTSIWNAIVPQSPAITPGETIPIPILETGYSGPFTGTVSDSTAASIAPGPTGFEHTMLLTFAGQGSQNLSVTITDAHGRSQTQQVSWTFNLAVRRRGNSSFHPSKPH